MESFGGEGPFDNFYRKGSLENLVLSRTEVMLLEPDRRSRSKEKKRKSVLAMRVIKKKAK